MKCLLTFALLICALLCSAQKRKSPKCPPAARTSNKYFRAAAPEQWFMKAEGGLRHSLLYHDHGSYGDNHFRFVSRPQPYISIITSYTFDNNWGIFLGGLATQTMQGLQFRYGATGYRRKDNLYKGSIQFRFPIGATYSFAGWKAYAAPVVTYNSFFSELHNGGALRAGTASSLNYTIEWPGFDSYDQWNMGLDASLEKKITGRLYANINAAIDFYPSVTSSAIATAQLNTTHTDVYKAEIQPYLCYIGFGLNYRIFNESKQ